MRAKRPTTFEDRVLQMARCLVEYHYYGDDENKAVKILHKHHPELERSVCARIFGLYTRAYADSIVFVNAHSKTYWERYNARHQGAPEEDFPAEREFFRKHPEVPVDILGTMIFWIFDWHHVR